MPGITKIRHDDYSRFNQPLKNEDLSFFDTKPNSSLVILKKSDFMDNQNWSEFVSRYVKTPQSSREKYFLEQMSNPLKEELIWSLVQLNQNIAIPTNDKQKILLVLKEDFQIDPRTIKDRGDINAQFDKSKYTIGMGSYLPYNNDQLRNSHQRLLSNYLRGNIKIPFRFSSNNIRIDPNISFIGGYVTGKRKLESKKVENIGYTTENTNLDINIRDSKRDKWNLGGSAGYIGRQKAPTGYSNNALTWNGRGGIDHLFDLPLDLTLTINGLHERFLPPSEEGQFHRVTDETTLNSPLTLVFNDFALKGGYSLYSKDSTNNYSSEKQTKHTGYLWGRFQKYNSYWETGLNISSIDNDRKRQSEEGLIQEKTKRAKVGLGGEYYYSFGRGKSIWSSALLNYVHSEGDLNADFISYYLGLNGTLNILPSLELNLKGDLTHSLIHQDGQDYDLTTKLFPALTWHITKSMTLSGSGVFQHTLSTGKYSENSKSLNGELCFTASFNWFTNLKASLAGGTGREWDNSNFDTRAYYIYSELYFSL